MAGHDKVPPASDDPSGVLQRVANEARPRIGMDHLHGGGSDLLDIAGYGTLVSKLRRGDRPKITNTLAERRDRTLGTVRGNPVFQDGHTCLSEGPHAVIVREKDGAGLADGIEIGSTCRDGRRIGRIANLDTDNLPGGKVRERGIDPAAESRCGAFERIERDRIPAAVISSSIGLVAIRLSKCARIVALSIRMRAATSAASISANRTVSFDKPRL